MKIKQLKPQPYSNVSFLYLNNFMKTKHILQIIVLLLTFNSSFAALPAEKSLSDCKKSIVEGNSNYIIGCGTATNFGHNRGGGQDTLDDGNTFCNTKKEKNKYTYRNDRSASENLKVKFAALRMNDISRIFGIPKGRKALGKNRSKWCGKEIKIKDMVTGRETTAVLMDIMSNNNKVIDLTGGVLNDLGAKGNPKVQITWANIPTI